MSGPLKLKGEELKFPVDWEFRVIVEAAAADAACAAIAACLEKYSLPPAVHEGLHSEGGKYRSFKAAAVLETREIMEALAADLAAIEGVKFLL